MTRVFNFLPADRFLDMEVHYSEAMDPLAESDPRQLGPYRIVARLGSGGMGVVFLGSKGSQRVAVKVMRSSFLDSPTLKTRFEREIATLKKIKSPFVAKYLDSDIEGDLVWHAVEFVNGPTLKEKVENDGPLNEEDWWALYSQMREALKDIHREGVVHRDLKPSNIILSEGGMKLIDFGISQDSEATSLTSTGMVAGSPAWLSPEQLEGTEVGSGSDLFSAGSILTYAAIGRSPWGSETTMTVPVAYKKILNRDFDLEELPSAFKDVISPLFREEASERAFVSVLHGRREGSDDETPLQSEKGLGFAEPTMNPEEPATENTSPQAPSPKRSRKLGLVGLLSTAILAGGVGFVALTTSPPSDEEALTNQIEYAPANQVREDTESSPPCKKPTFSDNFRLSRSQDGNSVEILVRPMANIATCVGGVEKVVASVTDLREKPPGYRFYGGPWTPVTCKAGNQISQVGSRQYSPTQSVFELAFVGGDKFQLVCVDEGALEPWPLEITFAIELGNFDYPIQYTEAAELSAFRE